MLFFFSVLAGLKQQARPKTALRFELVGFPRDEPIDVVRQPEQAWLEEKGVFGWDTWTADSDESWGYTSAEQCYVLEGEATIVPDDDRAPVTLTKGDFARLPAGLQCTWEVKAPLKKHVLYELLDDGWPTTWQPEDEDDDH
ncbi:hypothetical protein CTAYLR_009229 [Chrysophaeum taylorii]|uniref:(S)-ureidoglycine aminohydrolase cupin domain-containing protein n=1 Tax=Chrysophaeum taylorii TaxID=2483200 RepID=A0AAD7UF02_9STRA|nr:hypothetical protein CTAYLR_009229 [Chrysophaeum taylorii]